MSAAGTVPKRKLPKIDRRRSALRVVYTPDSSARCRTFAFDGSSFELGREVEGTGRIADPRMSRRHARVAPSDALQSYAIEDLGGGNGTIVGGKIERAPVALLPNTVVTIGDTILVVDREPNPDDLPIGSERATIELPAIAGISFTTERMREAIASAGTGKGGVLLLGPTGAGKEVAARAIHDASGRAGPFVAVNCAAIPAQLAESELFGHTKGAFTGATEDREGHFARAEGGTLLLDEIGDLAPNLQAKLLRVLEDGVVQPIGSSTARTVAVRVIAATSVDLESTAFRRDLFARLSDWVLRIPPLAEHKADVLALWEHFLRAELGSVPPYTSELAEALLLHDWPMNVRELMKLARRVSSGRAPRAELDLEVLPYALEARVLARHETEESEVEEEAPAPDAAGDYKTKLQRAEVAIILDALENANGNQTAAAKKLGMPLRTLVHKMKTFGIKKTGYSSGE